MKQCFRFWYDFRRKSLYGKLNQLCRFAFFPYLFAVLWLTLFNRESTYVRKNLTLFWEYRELFFGNNPSFFFGQIIGNLAMLFPLGFMLPFLSPYFRKGGTIFWISCLFSISIELTQLFSARGLCEFDDVFNNTLGAMMGYALYLFTVQVCRKSALKN